MTAQTAGVVGIVGIASAVGALVMLHLLPTGLSPVGDAVSHYGITRYRAGYRVLTLSMGVSGLALAWGLHDYMHTADLMAVLCLVAFAVARLAISGFPMDEPGSPPTPQGRRHLLLAFIAFAGLALAAGGLAREAEVSGEWAGDRVMLRVLSWLLLVSALLMAATVQGGWRRYFGIAERAFYLVTFAWLAVVAIRLV